MSEAITEAPRTYRTRGHVNEANYCREHGLLPGTVLVGDEGYGPTWFKITALGEEKVLARSSRKGPTIGYRKEHSVTPSCRDWEVVTDA